jgi:hypothetical protein
LAYSSILKTENVSSSETSVNLYQTKWHHIPEDTNLHSNGCENIKYKKKNFFNLRQKSLDSFTLKVKAADFSRTLLTTYQTIRRHITGDGDLRSHCHQNLKSHRPGNHKNRRDMNMEIIVEFEVLTAVVMKRSICWDITPRSPLESTDVSEEHVFTIFRVEE